MKKAHPHEFIFCTVQYPHLVNSKHPLYLLTARRYQSSEDVANSYDQWTEDGIVEFYWGEHIHLGHYGSPPQRQDFMIANPTTGEAVLRDFGKLLATK